MPPNLRPRKNLPTDSHRGTKRKAAGPPPQSRATKLHKPDDYTETRDPNNACMDNDPLPLNLRARPINGRFLLYPRLGHGDVFLARDLKIRKDVALKLEPRCQQPPALDREAAHLRKLQRLKGFPQVYWAGIQDDFRVMAMELLGPSLDDLFAFCDYRFAPKTTYMIMDELLARLQSLHSRKVVHRNLRPSNCLLGLGPHGNIIYLTDFGLASKIGPIADLGSPSQRRSPLVGTATFASVGAHERCDPSFRDDLESLGYMARYFLRGFLPWEGIKQEDRVIAMKSISIHTLCAGLPWAIKEYFKYIRALEHDDVPDYKYLRQLFRDQAKRDGCDWDYVYDWTVKMFLQSDEAELSD